LRASNSSSETGMFPNRENPYLGFSDKKTEQKSKRLQIREILPAPVFAYQQAMPFGLQLACFSFLLVLLFCVS